MTPFPLLLLLWGIAMWFDLLPDRIAGFIPFRPTPFWLYTKRILAIAAMSSGSVWLACDIWLTTTFNDRAGWAIVIASAISAAGFIASTWQRVPRSS